MKPVEDVLLNGRLGKAITRVVGKPGTLRFRLARDTVGVMAIRALSMGLGFAVSVVLARLLGVREFGLYSLAMSVLGLLVVPATFGFPQLLVREIAAYRVKGEWGLIRGLIRFARRTSLLASLGIALLGWLVLWLLSDRFSGEAVRVLALAFLALPFWALLQLHGEALRGFEQILAGQWTSTVMRPLGFLILVGVAWVFTGGIAEASLALGLHILAAGIALTFAFLLLRSQLSRSVPSHAVSQNTAVWTRSALSLAFLALLNLIPQHAGVLMLGWMRGAEEVGLYKVAYQSAAMISLLYMVVATVIAPTLSQLHASGDLQRLKRVLHAATLCSLAILLPFLLVFTIGRRWFLITVFGNSYLSSTGPLSILALAFSIEATFGPLWEALVMGGYQNGLVKISLLSSILFVCVNAFLANLAGSSGTAIAFVLFYAFRTMLIVRFAKQQKLL